MLSYQHGFHAGNHADVLKHSVLCWVLASLLQKEKPLMFFDVHGGRGFYDLQHPMTQKTGEYREGIARIWGRNDLPVALRAYLDTLTQFNSKGGLRYYAGSSLLAQSLLRSSDRVMACELHPQEYLALRDNCEAFSNVRVQKADGYQVLKAALPPKERRAVILLDPSYELASDDTAVVEALREGLKRFANGIYLLWYPVAEPRRARKLVNAVAGLPVEKLLQLELYVRGPAAAGAMMGSGMLVLNPPWQLFEAMREALPWLVDNLAEGEEGRFVAEMLKAEPG